MTGKLDTFPQMVVEAIQGWQLFRTMGYPAKEIFLAFTPKGDDHDVLIMLKHRGKEAALRIGTLNGAAPETFQDHWVKAAEVYRSMTPEEREPYWKNSMALAHGPITVMNMITRGLGTTPEQIEEMDRRGRAIEV